MLANDLQHQIDRFVAVSLLINDELLDADLAGLTDLFSQREKCLHGIAELLSDGETLTAEQKSLLSQQDEFTVALINRVRGDLRDDMDRTNLERKSRQIYSGQKATIYELTG